MNRRLTFKLAALHVSVFVTALLTSAVRADDWPQFRGPARDGICTEQVAFPVEWSADRNVRWRAALPAPANSSPIVAAGRVFVTYAEEEGQKRHLVCLDRDTGGQVWIRTVTYNEVAPTHKTNPYCGSTPATDGTRIVVWHGSAGLFCYNMSGELQWQRDFGKVTHEWGYGASPVIHRGRVILHVDPDGPQHAVVALDLAEGQVLWQTPEPEHGVIGPRDKEGFVGSWTTPVLAAVDGQEQIICSMPTRVVAYDPTDGRVVWYANGLRHDGGDLAYSDPLIAGDLCVVTGGYRGPAMAIRLGGNGDVTETNRLWRTTKNPQNIGSGVLVDGYLRANAGPGTLDCLDAKTGEEKWTARAGDNCWGSIILAGGHLYVTNQSGTTFVFRPNPEEFELVAKNPFAERCNSTPAFSSGEIFLRTFKHVYCIDRDDAAPANSRRPSSDEELRAWLVNMVGYHSFSPAEVREATGLTRSEIEQALDRIDVKAGDHPPREAGEPLTVLPYPGGRHPRIGFLEGAIRPQRETKVSVFTPWDPASYVVVDVPEAIWSNLGLTYLAHTHIPTIWDAQQINLPSLEWQTDADGLLTCERTLPNGIVFGTRIEPGPDVVRMEMWLTNGTDEKLTDLRVQNCVMLKAAAGFEQQTSDNKFSWGPYAVCHNDSRDRWIITAWSPIGRVWNNARCPCLHSDPKFPDCEPAQTQRLRGWLSFYEGTNIHAELARIERTNWRREGDHHADRTLLGGAVFDAESRQPIPARIHIQSNDGNWHHARSVGGTAVTYARTPSRMPASAEVHTTLSADPFAVDLPPGEYTIRVERGKEYQPREERVTVRDAPLYREFHLRRWINMADRGWYSGDTHVHRSIDELPNAMLAEDLNVALPLTYWVRDADVSPTIPESSARPVKAERIEVDPTHVIYPVNTEYEIFKVGNKRHTLGAVFVLNHREPLEIGAPPVAPIAHLARNQHALLDLDKHSWPWSLMLVPVMDVDLFELANNHVWQTEFGFKQWTLDTTSSFMDIDRDADGFTEWGWIDYGFKTYYALLNCGFRLRVSAGTASGVHPVQLGFGRVYVHLPDGFNYDAWIAGLDAGRSFVTTGPMLNLRFNGEDAGHHFTLAADETARLKVTGTAYSQRPLERIELIVNGQLARTIEPGNFPDLTGEHRGGFVAKIDELIERPESFWLAVRCFEQHPEGRVRFAHTNPVFVDVAGKPSRPRKTEVAYFMERIQEEIARNDGVLTPEAVQEYRQALEVYREIAKTAR